MNHVDVLEKLCVDHKLGSIQIQDMHEFYDSCIDSFMNLRSRPGQMSKREIFELKDAANMFAFTATRNYLRETFKNTALADALRVKPKGDYDREC